MFLGQENVVGNHLINMAMTVLVASIIAWLFVHFYDHNNEIKLNKQHIQQIHGDLDDMELTVADNKTTIVLTDLTY